MNDQELINRAVKKFMIDKYDLVLDDDGRIYGVKDVEKKDPSYESISEFFSYNDSDLPEFNDVMLKTSAKHGIDFSQSEYSMIDPYSYREPYEFDGERIFTQDEVDNPNQQINYPEDIQNKNDLRIKAMSNAPDIFNSVSSKIKTRMKALE